MKKTWIALALICLGSLALRLMLLPYVRHPGISDPNHYYNLGRELVHGHGFQIDYIWHYYNSPKAVVHPTDWWLPLTGVVTAASMAVFGDSVHGALVVFMLVGSLLPIVAYAASRQLKFSTSAGLFAAAATGVLPELYLNSLRTNTLVLNAVLVPVLLMLLVHWLRTRATWAMLLGGALGGLAYLTRGENVLLLLMLPPVLIGYALVERSLRRRDLAVAALGVVVAVAVAAPWLIRNYRVHGWLTAPGQGSVPYYTDYRDLYAYERDFNWQTYRAEWSMGQIIGKRLFEMAACVKIMYTTLDMFLPVAVWGGLLYLLAKRDRERLMTLFPAFIFLGGLFLFYTIIVPYFSQGGSFKKSFLSMAPLLIPVGAYVMEVAIPDGRLRLGTMILVIALLSADAVELTRADIRFTDAYLDDMQKVADELRTLPDTNGDGTIVVMCQDPFMFSFLGIEGIAIPMESREKILEVAQRYGADYLMMPPDRPALDPLYDGTETDPRFVLVSKVPKTHLELYGFVFDAQ